jgi:uncharacterized iron-regulated membrane protein
MSALLIIITVATGVLLVWKEDYVRMTIPAAKVDFEPIPQNLAPLASAIEARYDPNEILLIEFPTTHFPLAKVRLTDTRYAYLDISGEVVDEWTQNERWEEWVYDLHHRLVMGDIGLTIVGFLGIGYIGLVVAGLISFWPVRRGFKLGLWPKGTSRLQLLLSHRNLGIISAVPLLLILTTAVITAFPEKAQELLLEPFRGDEYSLDFAENLDSISGGDSGTWLPALQRAVASFPGAEIRTVQVPNDYSPYRIVGLQQHGDPHPQGLSRIYIEAEGGWMDIRIDSQAQHLSERLFNLAYPLHTGRFDNLTYKIYLTLVGLLVTLLATLGLISFCKSKSLWFKSS